jgi:uncharacterized protein (DUF885 family)
VPGEFETFEAATAAFLNEYFEAEPVGASFFGLTEWDDRLPDSTAAGFARREADARRWLDHFAGYDADAAATAALSFDERVDLALLQAYLGQQVATAGFAHWRRYPTTYLENGVFELFMHGTRDEAAATAAAVARLAQVPATLAAGRANLDPALVDADLVHQWAIPNTMAQASFLREGLGVFVDDPTRRDELERAGAVAAESYEAFGAYLGELAGRASGSFVFGEANYDAVLRIGEGFEFGARTLREMGREQVASLTAEMEALAGQIDGDGTGDGHGDGTGPVSDWQAVIDRLRDDHPASMDELLAFYRAETERARTFVRTSGIMSIPEGESCAVEPAPLFLRAAAPVASYFPPPFFGPPSRGTFNVPFTPDDATPEEQLARLRSNSFFEIPGVTAHEAYPGHHLHFAAAQKTNALRQVLTSTYMTEGWGLYVEQMVGEHGFYLTPEAKLGQLSMRLFRAGRIVVDTSLHLGEMTIEEATTFMAERCGFPVPTAHREVLRYCSYPTQASSYLTGALEIERMAGEWTGSGRGTLAAFHDALTRSGKLPLGVAARAIGLV